MRTSKMISTISYNSESFLLDVLRQLVTNKKICDWMYIKHQPEEDEKKCHIHLFIKPNTLIDTMVLQEMLREPDPNKIGKFLGCIDFHVSNYDDWILYNLHFKPYLLSKGESRVFEYSVDDIQRMDDDNFEFHYNHSMKGSDWSHQFLLLQDLQNGFISPIDLINSGRIPLQMATALKAYNQMSRFFGHKTERGNRENHENNEMSS